LHSGQRVAEALRQRGYDVVVVEGGTAVELVSHLMREPVEVALVTLAHGAERQAALGALELLGIPHAGSAPLPNALSCDRLKSKELFRLHNLPTLPHYLVGAAELAALKDVHGSFGYPVQVSPRSVRADLSAVVAADLDELSAAVGLVVGAGEQAVVERVVEGTEVHAALLDGRMLGALALRDGVWQPPALESTRLMGILNHAERAGRVLECRGPVSVSLLVTQGGNEYVQEVDAAPSLGLGSLLTELSARVGFSFGELCESLAQSALRQRRTVRPAAPISEVSSTRPSSVPASAPSSPPLAPTRWNPVRDSVTPVPQRVAV
jgi:D-alanine-D-alanine ligase